MPQASSTFQLASTAVLLALLLCVEFVPIALAASIVEHNAFVLACIESPEFHLLLTGPWHDGQPAGS